MELDPSHDPRWAAQRLAAVGSIAALVGHQARNRLAVVRAALELIEAGLAAELTPEHGAAFVAELDRFLGDFNLGLEMIRCHTAGMKAVSARESIAEAVAGVRALAERAGALLRIEDQLSADDRVEADPLLLRQSILNLARNAIEALKGRQNGQIIVSSVAGDPWRIEVADNGPGLPAAMTRGAPAAGFSLRRGGLGLTLCRDAMTLMGGELSYVPSAAGARFRLTLKRPA